MASKLRGNDPKKPSRPPGTTPDDREKQLIAAAVDRAEQQLRDGTASSQVITHYLKLGSSRERLEQARIRNENLVLQAKVEEMESRKVTEAMYAEVLAAMREYSGQDALPENEEFE